MECSVARATFVFCPRLRADVRPKGKIWAHLKMPIPHIFQDIARPPSGGPRLKKSVTRYVYHLPIVKDRVVEY